MHGVGRNTSIPTYFRLVRPQVTGPGVGVAILLSLLSKVSGHIAVDNGLAQCHALQGGRRVGERKEWNRGRREGRMAVGSLEDGEDRETREGPTVLMKRSLAITFNS